jgi:hypothetical protein
MPTASMNAQMMATKTKTQEATAAVSIAAAVQRNIQN